MSAKRTWAGYKMFNDSEEPIGDFNFNWGKTDYNLLNTDATVLAKFKYSYQNTYADFTMDVVRGDRKFSSKRPLWDENKGCFTMTFNRKDYQASAKNFQLQDENDQCVAELGKMEDGYYRIEYDDCLDRMSIASLAMTRFHV